MMVNEKAHKLKSKCAFFLIQENFSPKNFVKRPIISHIYTKMTELIL